MCEIPNTSEYSLWKGRIKCCFRWAMFHSYIPQKSPTSVLAESLSLFDDGGMKNVIADEFAKGLIYIDLVKNVFFIDADINGLDELFVILNQLRFFESTDNGVTQHSLSHQPINLDCHVDFIEMLMKDWLKRVNIFSSVAAAVQKLTFSQVFDGSSITDVLTLWINEVIGKVKEMNELNDDTEEIIFNQQYPHVSALEDLYDGKALALLLYYYCPDYVRFTDVCLNEPISVPDAWHNLELVLDYYNNRLVPSSSTAPVCPAIKPSILHSEDILYYDDELKIPFIVFISNLFIQLEQNPGKLVAERDCDTNSSSTVTKSETKQLVDVSNMISNATKRSFLKQQTDQLSSSTKSTPDIFKSSLSNKPLLSRRHINNENRPYTCEQLSYSHSETKLRSHTSAAIRNHPLRKSASLHDIDRSPATSSNNLSSRAKWRKKRQEISIFKKQLYRNSMGESQSTQSASSAETVNVNNKPTSSSTALLTNVHIDSDDDSASSGDDTTKTHRVKSPALASASESIDQMHRFTPLTSSINSTTPSIIPDAYSPELKNRSPSKASSQSSYTITSGGFSTAESAIAAGVPVISSSLNNSSYHTSPRVNANRTRIVASNNDLDLIKEDELIYTLKPTMTSWSHIGANLKKKNENDFELQEAFSSRLMKRNKVEAVMQLSQQLKQKRLQIIHDEEQQNEKMEKERGRVLLNIRREMYMYGLQLQDLQQQQGTSPPLVQTLNNAAWTDHAPASPRNQRSLVHTETQTSNANFDIARNSTEPLNGQQYFDSPLSQTYIYKPGVHAPKIVVENKKWIDPPSNVTYNINKSKLASDEQDLVAINGFPDNDVSHSPKLQNNISNHNYDKLLQNENVRSAYDVGDPFPNHDNGHISINNSNHVVDEQMNNPMTTSNDEEDVSNQPTRRSLFASTLNQLDDLDKRMKELQMNETTNIDAAHSKWNDVTMSYNSFCELNAAKSNHSTPSKQLIDQVLIDNNNANNNTTTDLVHGEETFEGDFTVPEEVSTKAGKGFEIITERSPLNELNRKKEQFLLKQLKKEEDMKRKKVEREVENELRKEEIRLQQEQSAAKKEEERLRQQRLEEYKKRKERQEEVSQDTLKPGLISSTGKKKPNRVPALTVPLTPSSNMTYVKQAVNSSPSRDDLMLSSGDFISNKLKFSPTRMAKSHNHINEIGRDWDLASNASGTSLEYTGYLISEEEVTDATASAMMDTTFFGCDFEDGYCGWTNDTGADFSWLLNKGETESKDTGPPWDHTIGRQKGVRGYYVYIEASSPRKNGDRARLISPPIGKPGTYCLKFWHHMHGSEIKDLNVYLKNINTDQQQTIGHWSGPWSIETDIMPWQFENKDWWNEEQIQFVANGNSQIVLEGVRGENYHGDIALDDISLTVGECPQRSINCTFDRNMCGWTQMSRDDFNWLPNRGPTNTQFTGPSSDHHDQDQPEGLYMYIEASWPRQDGDKARMLSPRVKCVLGAKPVLLFWYNMFGEDVGPLRVYVTNDPEIIDFPLWEKNTPQGQQWQLGQVPIPQDLIDNFMIIIEAERKEYRGDVAIDDVTLIGCDEPSIDYLTLKTSTAPSIISSSTTTAAPKISQ